MAQAFQYPFKFTRIIDRIGKDQPEHWLPDEMPEPWKDSRWRWLSNGPRYYRTVTQPFVQTGQIAEYQPEYMQ